MKIKSLLVTVFIFFSVHRNAHSQNLHLRDSLLKQFASRDIHDTTKSLTATALARFYRFSLTDTAFAFAERGIALGRKTNFYKGIARALNTKGLLFRDQGKVSEAVACFRMSIKNYRKIGSTMMMANGYNNLGLTWDDIGKREEAFNSYDSALLLYKRIDDKEDVAETLNNFGQHQRVHGNYQASLEFYLESLKMYESIHASNEPIKMVLGNIGITYEKMENYPEAISYYKKAIAICPPEDSVGRGITLSNLGNTYELSGDLEKSEEACTEAIRLFSKSNYMKGAVGALAVLGRIKMRRGDLKGAIVALTNTLEIATKMESYENQTLCLNNLAETYLKLSDISRAQGLAWQALTISKRYQLPEQMVQALNNLSQIYVKKGDYKNGFDFYLKYAKIKDSLFNKRNLEQFYSLEKKYEVDKKQSEIRLLEKDNALKKAELSAEQNLRYGLSSLVVGLLILIGLGYYGFSSKARLNSKLRDQKEQLLKAQALRAQMNPHFIFNSLNSIQFLIVKVESTKALDYLAKFGLLLRKVMDNSEKDHIPLSEEIEILTLYVELEALRFEDSFEYKIESLISDANTFKIPPMVVQPYIENAIQHGLMPKSGERILRVTFSEQADSLLCEIQDNGIGRTEATEIAKRKNKIFASKGVEKTSERLKAINRVFNGKSEINIFDLTGDGNTTGTLVKILFAHA